MRPRKKPRRWTRQLSLPQQVGKMMEVLRYQTNAWAEMPACCQSLYISYWQKLPTDALFVFQPKKSTLRTMQLSCSTAPVLQAVWHPRGWSLSYVSYISNLAAVTATEFQDQLQTLNTPVRVWTASEECLWVYNSLIKFLKILAIHNARCPWLQSLPMTLLGGTEYQSIPEPCLAHMLSIRLLGQHYHSL